MRREIPPTAGLPLRLRDFLPPWRADFAQQAAAFAALPHAGLACSGTACLILILRTLQRSSPRREVIIPAYTCPLVVLAIAHCGLEVRLCDLAPDSFDMDRTALAALCSENTLAIIPTHLAGRLAAVDEACEIAAQHGARVIEDAAQSFGARKQGRSVGLRGDAGFFSFAAGKGLSLYEGGLWTTRDAALAQAIAQTSREIIPRDMRMEWQRNIEMVAYAALYHPLPLRLAYGMPLRRGLASGNLAEAVGDVFDEQIPLHPVGRWRQSAGSRALQRLSAFHATLRAQAQRRCAQLAALTRIRVFTDGPDAQGVWPSLMLLLPTAAARDAAMAELWGAGLGVTRMFVHALPDYDYLRPWLPPADCPLARDFAARSLTISNSPWLDDARFAQIMAVLARHAG